MSSRYAYTYEEAQARLALYKEAERSIIEGTAKAYRINTREYTALDLDEIRRAINYFADIVESYESGTVRTRRVVVAVPRDM